MQNLKLLREKKGYTQAYIAKLANVHQPTYSCWERGKVAPTMAHVQQLAKILGVTMDTLINTNGGRKPRGRPKSSVQKTPARDYLEHKTIPEGLDKSPHGFSESEAMDYFCQFTVEALKEKDTQKLISFFCESLKRIRANI
jgi:transcriptional regulator with XRE-family HTH domain